MMMNNIGTKLSGHLLGMKFMRRTKEQVDKDITETTFRKHYGSPAVSKSKKSRASISATSPNTSTLSQETSSETGSCIVEEIGSYSQCEGHIFGRQSFGGFNPVLEANVKKGIWRPFYLEPSFNNEADDDEEGNGIKVENDEMDISDEEMAKVKTIGSLVGTLGKRFAKKRDRSGKNSLKDNSEEEEGEIEHKHASSGPSSSKKKRKGWKKFFGKKEKEQKNKIKSEPAQGDSPSKNKNYTQSDISNEPPNKKRKFMKPSE